DFAGVGEKPRRAVQGQAVEVQALLDLEGDLVGDKGEPGAGLLADTGVTAQGKGRGGQQPGKQQGPGQQAETGEPQGLHHGARSVGERGANEYIDGAAKTPPIHCYYLPRWPRCDIMSHSPPTPDR